MAEESIHLQIDNQTLEVHLVTLFEKLESLREAADRSENNGPAKLPMQIEIRTLEFWRSIICECLASFVYVFVVCGAAAGSGTGTSFASILITTSLAAGFSMTTLTQCFGHISGAHVNPAVTIAKGLTKGISVLRTVLFIIAQCGGAIAGAAFLYGVSIPGHKANLAATIAHTSNVAAWERFGVEFILTFVVVLTYFVSMDTYRKWTNTSTITIGAAYSACTFVSMPYLNPARSLGPSFVLSKWDNHWVYWLGPLIGGAASGLIYEYILNPRRHGRKCKGSGDGDSSSIRSDEDTYDDLDKPATPKFHGSTYNTYRPSGGAATNVAGGGYCPSVTSTSLYSAPPTKLERVESLYGGTKSLYCKSPPLTRANLNRSQSVYTKSNTGVNRDILPRPGPLVPAQSLYPMRLNQSNQQNHAQNQNMQNQMQQRSESIYAVRGVTSGAASRSDNYSTTASDRGDYTARTTAANSDNFEGNQKNNRSNRPESMYGMVGAQRRGLSAQSDDSSYGSYHGSSMNRSNANGNSAYSSSNNYPAKSSTGNAYNGRGNDVRQSPPTQLLPTSTSSSYHHNVPQHSPNTQY